MKVRGTEQIRALEPAWQKDTVATYPFLFDLTTNDCFNSSLKIYVYETPDEFIQFPLKCSEGQWGTEVLFHKWFLQSSCRTTNPDEADFFYVPNYGTCTYVRINVTDDSQATEHIWRPLFHYLRKQPQFHRKSQLDHIFLFADGQGPRIWDAYDLVRADAIFFSVETKCPTWETPLREWVDIQSCMSKWKDFIIPGHTDYSRMWAMRDQNKPSHKRSLLATWHGRFSGVHFAYKLCGVRDRVMSLKDYPGMDVGGFVNDYLVRKGDAHFCLVPGGTSPWTNHLYESFFCGCIPVILSDEYDVAFNDLPWETFSIKWPEKHVGPELYQHLRRLVDNYPEVVTQMKHNIDAHACWFDYYSADPNCSPFLKTIRALEERLEKRPRWYRYWNTPRSFAEDDMAHLSRPTLFHSYVNETKNSGAFHWLDRNADWQDVIPREKT
eukprot:GEMP01034388.1.p1 GENE.GEMP01034388.1~~GEMP01034388.1.p1  ORF type:complete len:438 (+),score=63.67 GEMP01034388.1:586-1899(+)